MCGHSYGSPLKANRRDKLFSLKKLGFFKITLYAICPKSSKLDF